MARLSHADQGGLFMPGFHSGGAHCPRFGAVSGSSAAQPGAARPGHTGVAELLFEVAHDRSRTVPGTRLVHPVDEAEKHTAASARGIAHHAFGAGVLRLKGDESRRAAPFLLSD